MTDLKHGKPNSSECWQSVRRSYQLEIGEALVSQLLDMSCLVSKQCR